MPTFLLLDRDHAVGQLTQDLVAVTELGWNAEPESDALRHRALFAEEVPGAGRVEWRAGEQRAKSIDAGPVVNSLDETILDRIGRGVDQLVEQYAFTGWSPDLSLEGWGSTG
ncbi:MAG: hypothetical protein NT062_08750 [Proteobacteria bacterium]|nr:hypothetical protein [Pseudomonadota bacterium]